jgi:formylglycine-generating enzyme required for sulfatase activity
VEDPLVVTPDELRFEGSFGGPFDWDPQTFRVVNEADAPISWQVDIDQVWVRLNGLSSAGGSANPGIPINIEVTVDEGLAAALVEGTHTAVATFTDMDSGHAFERPVAVVIGEFLSVSPSSGLYASVLADGSAIPAERVYTITNLDSNGIDWEINVTQPWMRVNYGLGASGHLEPGESADARVSIDVDLINGMQSDAHGEILFIPRGDPSQTARRPATVTVSHSTLPGPQMVTVPGSDIQPGGPDYDFAISLYEVTNDAFILFLNDAMANLENHRGHYLYFDTDTGSVYIHAHQAGATGPAGSGTPIFDADVNSHITFDGVRYTIADAGFADHPVTGVTWYGALKYCNWLTLSQGLGPDQRCYEESAASAMDEWRPVTIDLSDWTTRTLNDTERRALVEGWYGYRLPMDDGAQGAEEFNEWYKAAAWRPDLGQNMAHGFGRNIAGNADANWKDSGDPFDNGTTPVGYFDGTDHGGFATNANSNGYGLYDMTGNVFEWTQEIYGNMSRRTVRGGSWNYGSSAGPSVETTTRVATYPDVPRDHVGIRVVQVRPSAPTPGDLNADGLVDQRDYVEWASCLTGPGVAPPQGVCESSDFSMDDDVDLHDFSLLQVLIEPTG